MAKFMLISPTVRRLVSEADEQLGYSLIEKFRASEAEYSEYARIAFLVNCLALAEWSGETFGVVPGTCAGPSFGGTAAAVFSGSLSFPDAVVMTSRWSHRVDSYFATRHGDVVSQSLARTPAGLLAEVLAELDGRGEWHDLACHVDDDFHIVSLREEALDWFRDRVRAGGGMPLYTMRPPMHSRIFQPLREEIEEEVFGGLAFGDPVVPIVSDHDGSLLTTAAEVRTMLLDGIVRPVEWPTVVGTLKARGTKKIYVFGPDSLWGRVPCTTQNFEVVAVKPETAMRPRPRHTS
ncbi:ACP S-malonyltransferase [Streptosporangium sp. DT93]|uniref:ACP S-malonyltransferase n=1 Tax=Streptosporangium sp. DT93 TaxID=3393428 RepID=UPI003CFA0BA4